MYFGLIELFATIFSGISLVITYGDLVHLATVCSFIFILLLCVTIIFAVGSISTAVINICPTKIIVASNAINGMSDQPLMNSATGHFDGEEENDLKGDTAAGGGATTAKGNCEITRRAKCSICCSTLTVIFAILVALLHFKIVGNKRGPIYVDGLDYPVTTTIDSDGMLHIVAKTHHDVHFAQGLITAELRLWEMEFQRRVGRGTLSELVGEPGLGHDKMSRTLGLYKAAERAVDDLDAYGKVAINAYADGVNAYLRSNATLPFEMILLGVDPSNIDPWVPADSLVWGKIMSLELSGNAKNEWERFNMLAGANLTLDEVNKILPPFNTSRFPTVLTVDDLNTTSLRESLHVVDAASLKPSADALKFYESYRGTASLPKDLSKQQKQQHRVRLLRSIQGHGASNNWVVGGSRTKSGKPLLANDPHLQLTAPSVWLAAHLKVENSNQGNGNRTNPGPMDVWGASFAGVPGIVTGRNAYISWGVTNTGVDVQDLFVMEEGGTDGKSMNQYKWNGKWIDYNIRKETIHVKDEDDIVINIRESKTGVIITDNGVAEQLGCSHKLNQGLKQTIAFRWVSTDPNIPDQSPGCFLKINLAKNFDEYRDALRGYVAPAQNFIFADINGNIGYQMPGFVPRRAEGHTGKTPIKGDGSFHWKADTNNIPLKIDFDHMPRAYNPKKGFIASANNQVVPPIDPITGKDPFAKEGWVLSHDWDGSNMGYRSRRITEMIEEWSEITTNNDVLSSTSHTLKKINMTGLQNMQQDYKSGLWVDFSPYLSTMLIKSKDSSNNIKLSDKSIAWIPKLVDKKVFNGIMSVGKIEPTIFQKWLLQVLTLISYVPIPNGGNDEDRSRFLPNRMFNVVWVLNAMESGHQACGGSGTADDCLKFAADQLNTIVEPYDLVDAADENKLGKIGFPRWGIDLHKAVFEHQVSDINFQSFFIIVIISANFC